MTKQQSVNVLDEAYEHKPRFSISVLKEFSELFSWLTDLSRYRKLEDFIYISDYKKGEIRITIFTKDHQYYIGARLPKQDKNGADGGYLGCIVQTRKPRAGEDWNRGSDLADGGYAAETWQEIKDDILAYELVKVARNSPDKENGKAIEAMVDDKKELLIEMLEYNLPMLKENDKMGFIWKGKHFVIKQGEFGGADKDPLMPNNR